MLTKALEDPKYTTQQQIEILKRRHEIKKLRKNLKDYERASRGFGYSIDPSIFKEPISEISDSDTPSGTDDGVCSESEQSEQPGEP